MYERARRGRLPKVIKDAMGRPVIGLCHDRSTGQFFVRVVREGKRKKIHFGQDQNEVIARCFAWRARQKQRIIELARPVAPALAEAALALGMDLRELQSEVTVAASSF